MGRFRQGFQRFMQGRYGVDKLNMWILGIGAVVCVVAMLIPWATAKMVLTGIAWALMIWALWRTLSRNTYKRYRENKWLLRTIDRIKDRQHKHFVCPKCHQTVRVPRGKGKIAITCPKCRERFIKKT